VWDLQKFIQIFAAFLQILQKFLQILQKTTDRGVEPTETTEKTFYRNFFYINYRKRANMPQIFYRFYRITWTSTEIYRNLQKWTCLVHSNFCSFCRISVVSLGLHVVSLFSVDLFGIFYRNYRNCYFMYTPFCSFCRKWIGTKEFYRNYRNCYYCLDSKTPLSRNYRKCYFIVDPFL